MVQTVQHPSSARIRYAVQRSAPQPSAHLLKQLASHGHWHTFSLHGCTQIDKAHIDAYQDIVFRAKGFLFAGHASSSELLQFSAGRVHWQPALRSQQQTRQVLPVSESANLNAVFTLQRD